MERLPIAQFVEIIEGTLGPESLIEGRVVDRVATHSRRVRPGSAFFALPGTRTAGACFLAEAQANGAALAVVGHDQESDPKISLPLVRVADPLRALQKLAAWWRGKLGGKVIAVVGSNGKTITKDCLVHILGNGLPVYGSPGSYNSQLGVALALLECPRDVDFAVIEIAVSEPGEMRHHTAMVAPDHVLMTNVGTRWRSRFGSRTAQLAELLEIAATLPADGWLLLGEEDEDVEASARAVAGAGAVFVQHRSGELPTYGQPAHGPGGVVRLDVAFPSSAVAHLDVRTPSDEILGDIELAVSAAWLLDFHPHEILAALHEYRPTATRMEIWRSPSGVTVVRDVATPDPIAVGSAVRAARRLLRDKGRTVVVLAEPTSGWDLDAAERLAQALDEEQVDEVVALTSAQHNRTLATLQRLDSQVGTMLFPTRASLQRHLQRELTAGDVCLVQTEPGQPLGDLASLVIESMAPTRLYIDLSAIEDNVVTFRRLLGPDVRLMGMVKALAYGTDPVSISVALQDAGVDHLGVSYADEGVALRRAGVTLPILVMLGTSADVEKMLLHRLTPLLYSPEMFAGVQRPELAARYGQIPVHVDVDTGMHRGGFLPRDAIDVVDHIAVNPNLELEGLMTHLACADDPKEDAFTNLQLDRFDEVIEEAVATGQHPICHAAATAASVRFPRARMDMVRIGLGLYGLHPSAATVDEIELTPAIALVSRLVQVIDVPGGERVGYGGLYTAPPSGGRIGVVPAGYFDCVPREFSKCGYLVVAGARCPIAGQVSMDSMTVDISGNLEADVGSDVLIYGRQGDRIVPVEEVAASMETIPHEVMAHVGPRVQRIFTRH